MTLFHVRPLLSVTYWLVRCVPWALLLSVVLFVRVTCVPLVRLSRF